MQTETRAKLAVAYSGIAWGLFWLPLRQLHHNGLTPDWALIVFNLLPALMVLPVLAGRWRTTLAGGRGLLFTGIAMGLTQVFYALSVLHTEVIRAMMLFYFNPVWSALMARVIFHERFTPIRILSIITAFAGMAVILHGDTQWPWPRNLGDWAALTAGFAWSSAIILLRFHQHPAPLDLFLQNFAWSGLFLIPVVAATGWSAAPPLALVLSQLWWLVPFIVLVMMTGVYTSMWAVPKLSPGIVGLLYMTEISAAAISSALFSGEPFGWREVTGVALITLGGTMESLADLWRDQLRRQSR
jgi:drug/metabolite transporter (DMT)-like permease